MAITLNTWLGTYKFGTSSDPEMVRASAAAERRANRILKQDQGRDGAAETERLIDHGDDDQHTSILGMQTQSGAQREK